MKHRLSYHYFVQFFSCLILSLVTLQGLRLATLYQFYAESNPADLIQYFIYSFRWDLKLLAGISLIGFLLLGPLMLISLLRPYIKKIWVNWHLVFLFLITIISYIHVVYWSNITQPFDIFIFGIVDDQTSELLKLFMDQYHPIRHLIGIVLICIALFYANRHLSTWLLANTWLQKIGSNANNFANCLIVVLIILILGLATRGSTSLFPLNKKTTHFSSSQFLNNLAINAPYHLYYAIKEKQENSLGTDPIKALKAKGYADLAAAKKDLLVQYQETDQGVPLLARTHANSGKALPNIVLVMMESWSTQLLLAKSGEQNLLGSFQEQKAKGTLFVNSLSTRLGTNRFIESTLLNTSVLELSISTAKQHRLAYSNIQTLIQQGYQIAFVSGGARTWVNHDSFWRVQGVDYYWDMSDIIKAYGVKPHSDWGVDDEYTFTFAYEKLSELSANNKPVFMFVITTSNHPPHKVPPGEQPSNFPLGIFPNLLQPENAQLQMTTFHYATDQLGKFLGRLNDSKLNDNTIRVATGDHVMRNFYQFSDQKDKLLAGSVPLYFQIPAQYMADKQWDTSQPASHRDIFPTIFELILSNADYLKTGFNLLNPEELKAAWYEKNIWLLKDEVSFDTSTESFQVDKDLHTGSKKVKSDLMTKFQKHIQAQEALLEWQLISEIQQKTDQ